MPPLRKDAYTRERAQLLLESRWRPDAIAIDACCSRATAYRWERSIAMYGEPLLPRRLHGQYGPSQKLSTTAQESLLDYLRQKPWLYQQELVVFLKEEWDIYVHQSTISRVLKEARVSRKLGQRISYTQSDELRVAWQAFSTQVRAEQLVFIDESLFKLQTMWRAMAYAPIGEPARYRVDMNRGDTYSILPAYTTEGYLPCTGIKQGYYNSDNFFEWLTKELLPLCNEYPGNRSIICLDNVNVHINPRIKEAIEQRGCLVKYLPPYSPDYTPIELTFSVLKAWMRRHFESFRTVFQGNFEGFLRYAIENSRCDRFAMEHFRYSDAGYIFQGDIEAFEQELER